MDVAREMLASYGSLSGVAGREVAELARRPRRRDGPRPCGWPRPSRSRGGSGRATARRRVVLGSPEQVFARYGPLMEDLKREVFRVALLDAQNRLLSDVVISEGTLSASLVHPREVFKPAILESAASDHPAAQPPERGSDAEPGGPPAHAAAGGVLRAARSAHPRPRDHRPRAVHQPGPARGLWRRRATLALGELLDFFLRQALDAGEETLHPALGGVIGQDQLLRLGAIHDVGAPSRRGSACPGTRR